MRTASLLCTIDLFGLSLAWAIPCNLGHTSEFQPHRMRAGSLLCTIDLFGLSQAQAIPCLFAVCILFSHPNFLRRGPYRKRALLFSYLTSLCLSQARAMPSTCTAVFLFDLFVPISAKGRAVNVRYIDPSYQVRSVPTVASDRFVILLTKSARCPPSLREGLFFTHLRRTPRMICFHVLPKHL